MTARAGDRLTGRSAPSPGTGAWTCSASTSSATFNSTAAARNSSSKSSPRGKRRTPSRSRPTNPSAAGTKTFTDPRLCAAIVDRLTFNGTIIETGTDSYRLNHTRASTRGAN